MGLKSDIVVVIPKKISDHSTLTVPFTLTFEWTDAATDTTMYIYTFDKYTTTLTNTGTTVACTAKVCLTTASYST